MSRTPNFHMNQYSGGAPNRNPGFSPYHGQHRGAMGPPGGNGHGYFPPSPQQGEAPMIGGGIIPGQRYPSHNNSPFSPPAFQQSPYQQSPGSSPHDSPNRGGGGGGRGGYQRRDSRGWGRGRGGGGGGGGRGGIQFTPSGHQQFHNRKRFQGGSPYQRGQHGGNSSVIERYFKPSMLEDPWKKLVAKKSSGPVL